MTSSINRLSHPSILVDNVDVRYSTLRVMRNFSSPNPLERIGLIPSRTKTHAVKGVSFLAHEGETIGIIGRNGSGKSTLLRAVAGLQEVQGGYIRAKSQPLFLGVKPALVPDRTGLENIELGCLAMGLSRSQTRLLKGRIAELTDLQDALKDPINTYSSGMRSRLGFCILAALPESDILIIDEALGTGDASFKERSREIMKNILDRSGTILVVSHSQAFIQSTCDRAIWLERGDVLMDGPAKNVLKSYRHCMRAFAANDEETAYRVIRKAREKYVPPSFSLKAGH